MTQFVLDQENTPELRQFVHSNEFALKKNNSVRLNSFINVGLVCLRFYYILNGKFDWVINGEYDTLYPADLGIILHGQALYAEKDYLEIGSLYWLNLHLNIQNPGSKNALRKRSNLTAAKLISIKKILFLNSVARLLKFPEKDCRSITLEVGMPNAGPASALAKGMGKIATVGLTSVIFGTMMNVTGSSLASWWRKRQQKLNRQKENCHNSSKIIYHF